MHACTHSFIIINIIARASPRPRRVDAPIAGMNAGDVVRTNSQSFIVCRNPYIVRTRTLGPWSHRITQFNLITFQKYATCHRRKKEGNRHTTTRLID